MGEQDEEVPGACTMTATVQQCEGTRRQVDGSPYRCPLRLRTPGKTLCGRCEMAIVEYGVEERWPTSEYGSSPPPQDLP